jgi:hypothetical protein
VPWTSAILLQASQSIHPAALLLGTDWSTEQGDTQPAVTGGLERRIMDEVTHSRIDEKSSGEGLDYVTMMLVTDESRVLEVTSDRTTESADVQWRTVCMRSRSTVRLACMDTWLACEAGKNRDCRTMRSLAMDASFEGSE